MLRLAAASAVVLAATMGTVQGADLPVPVYKAPPRAVVPGWAGAYAGLHAGYGTVDPVAYVNPASLAPLIPGFTLVSATPPFTLSVEPKGFFAGLQVGRNWQNDRWVYGLEADISLSAMRDTDTGRYDLLGTFAFDPAGFAGTVTLKQAVDYFGTLRGRLGYTFDNNNVLVFGTGGLAFAHVKTSLRSSHVLTVSLAGINPFPPGYPAALDGNASASEMQWGFALGGGVEWAFRPRWSLKGEYLYMNFNSGGTSLVIPGAYVPDTSIDTMHIVRVGLNYRFSE